MKGWGKIAFGVRSGNGGDPLFWRSWTRLLMKGLRPGDEVLDPAVEIPQHYAAEKLTMEFLAGKADSLMFLDDDMVFGVGAVDRMRDDPDGDGYGAVQALCLARGAPHRPVVLERHESSGGLCIRSQPDRDVMVPVALVGLAFTLVRREAIEAAQAALPAGEMLFYWGRKGESEDSGFSGRLTDRGYLLAVNTRVCVGHRFKLTASWDWASNGPVFVEKNRFAGLPMFRNNP